MVHAWLQALESKKKIVAIFYDVCKAFDSVLHAPLLQTLDATGLHSHILKATSHNGAREWLLVVNPHLPYQSYLECHKVNSVLGPLLFLIYINDVSNLAFSSGTFLNLFADDMLLYRFIDSLEDVVCLQ